MCAYCGRRALIGSQAPEHPIPRALGSSLEVYTVCHSCNSWANVHIDQPFLRDDWLRIRRAWHDVRDPRRPRGRVPDPLKQGLTKDGVRVTVDEDWRPHLGSRIVEDPADPGKVMISAGSDREAERLLAIVRKRAAAEGKELEIAELRKEAIRPWVNINVTLKLPIWLRATAKMALGIASYVYPPEWRSSSDADHLRYLMRCDKPRAEDGREIIGICPSWVKDDPIGKIAVPPMHVAWFTGGYDGVTRLFMVILGELMVNMAVDTAGLAVPSIAWSLDPRRPNAKGETTFDQLLMEMAIREELADEPLA
jgi:hypothetical protein